MPKIKQKSANKKTSLFILYSLGLLLAFSGALPAYVQSNFLEQFVSVQYMAAFLVLANLLTVVAILFFPKLIKTLTNYFLTKISLSLYAGSLLGLVIASNAPLALLSIIIFTISSNLIWINMDFLVESFSSNAITGRIRTIYFTFINIGWIMSPTISVYLLGKGEYSLIFLISAALTIPFFLTLFSQRKKLQDHSDYQAASLLESAKKMWRNPDLRGIFFISLLLQIFFNSAVIYIPLHLLHNIGLGWEILGPLFSIMLIPFLIVEIPAGIIADKYLGEKELLLAGFLILSASLFLFYYIQSPIPWVWGAVLFLSRIGAALIEAMRETYFFKIVDAKDANDINIFRATIPLGHTIGSILAIGVLFFLPLQYLFLLLSIIMFFGLLFVLSIQDTK